MYGTIAGWQEYVAARGIANQVITEESLPALVRASDYIKYHYVANFIAAYDETVPEVEMATYEVACIENNDPGFFSKTYTPQDAKVLMQVDSLRWEKPGRAGSDNFDYSEAVPISTKADTYLRKYMRLKSGAGVFAVGKP